MVTVLVPGKRDQVGLDHEGRGSNVLVLTAAWERIIVFVAYHHRVGPRLCVFTRLLIRVNAGEMSYRSVVFGRAVLVGVISEGRMLHVVIASYCEWIVEDLGAWAKCFVGPVHVVDQVNGLDVYVERYRDQRKEIYHLFSSVGTGAIHARPLFADVVIYYPRGAKDIRRLMEFNCLLCEDQSKVLCLDHPTLASFYHRSSRAIANADAVGDYQAYVFRRFGEFGVI